MGQIGSGSPVQVSDLVTPAAGLSVVCVCERSLILYKPPFPSREGDNGGRIYGGQGGDKYSVT